MDKINLLNYLSVLLMSMIFTVAAEADEWIRRGSYQYYFSSRRASQNTAREECIDLGADLTSIENVAENNFITQNKPGTGYWIGLYTTNGCSDCQFGDNSNNCRRCRNGWRWFDGTSYDFQNWESRRPSSTERVCGRLFNVGTWRDEGCQASYSFICKRTDPCENTPCVNGACEIRYSINLYNCECDLGYRGRHCANEIDECLSNPCETYEVCNNHIGRYSCSCPPGYSGQLCEIDIDECSSNPCQNGGTCMNHVNSFTCSCDGFTGILCETELDECSQDYVQDFCIHGICTNFYGSYSCSCFEGYEGYQCLDRIIAPKEDESEKCSCSYTAYQASLAVTLILLLVSTAAFSISFHKLRRAHRNLNKLQSKDATEIYYNETVEDKQRCSVYSNVTEACDITSPQYEMNDAEDKTEKQPANYELAKGDAEYAPDTLNVYEHLDQYQIQDTETDTMQANQDTKV